MPNAVLLLQPSECATAVASTDTEACNLPRSACRSPIFNATTCVCSSRVTSSSHNGTVGFPRNRQHRPQTRVSTIQKIPHSRLNEHGNNCIDSTHQCFTATGTSADTGHTINPVMLVGIYGAGHWREHGFELRQCSVCIGGMLFTLQCT